MAQFIVHFDFRSDAGPDDVGTFDSREAAMSWAEGLAGPGWEATWEVRPLAHPGSALRKDLPERGRGSAWD